MMMLRSDRMVRALIGAGLLVLACSRASGQIPWETPQLLAPGTQRGVSLLYVDYGQGLNESRGLLLAFRPADAPRGIGLRVSGTVPREDEIRAGGGVDVALPLFRHSPAFPMDVVWTSGLGAAWGDYWSVGLPVGVAASRVFSGSHLWFQPWTSTRVVLEGYFGADHPDETFELEIAAELGADIALRSARSIIVRGALSLGDRPAIAVGLQVSPRSATRAAMR